MARVLELIDDTGERSVPLGDTATLENGRVTYEGNGVRQIISKWLVDHTAEEVFNNADGWSNGYASLRERE
jgi:hypothetical protein